MSAMGAASFRAEQNGGIAVMDTTPIPHSISPGFLPNPSSSVQNQLMEPPSAFANMANNVNGTATSMCVPSMSEMVTPVFLNSIEAMVPPQNIRAGPPGFLTDLPTFDSLTTVPSIGHAMNLEPVPNSQSSSVSPPLSQVPSPSIHGSASSYSAGVTSSLESALDPPNVATRRANTSVSPGTTPTSFLNASSQAMSMAFAAPEAVSGKQDDPSEVKTQLILADMLSDIARTANSAREACVMHHNAEASSKVDVLKERISQVSQMFAGMMSFSAQETQYSVPPYPPPLHTPGVSVPEQTPLPFPSSGITSNLLSMDVSDPNAPDQSRKRCASEFDEPRTLKAPKREPQEDMLLSLPEASSGVDSSSSFAVAGISLPSVPSQGIPMQPSSRPASRPPTPPGFYSARGTLSPVKQVTISTYAPAIPSGTASTDFGSITPISSSSPTFPRIRTSWSDPVIPTRHHHSLSAGSLSGPVIPSSATAPVANGIGEIFPASALQQQPLTAAGTAPTISPPIGRMSRSGSINGAVPGSYTFNFRDPAGSWSSNVDRVPGKSVPSSAPPAWFAGNEGSVPSTSSSVVTDIPSNVLSTVPSIRNSPVDGGGDDDDDDDAESDDNDGSTSKSVHHASPDGPVGSASGSDVPQEYRAEVDRIFFEYLNRICSNLDATDSKGEPIHQTLMAKKMQRLDESPDFRPFKFRIQAFTLAFLEELARQGYPEEKIPMKKVRNYLWRQQYILRFNEDGKKAKSKGNHIWNIEAKKMRDYKWEFRPFHRKLAGSPPSVAYCGLRWSWTPRIWDPQASWQNVPVEYSSPSLPSWLSWKDDVLSGIPPQEAENCRITVNAKFVLDGQEGHLSHTFHLTIAPVSTIDTSFARSRRPSLAGDPPRRSTSDSVLFQAVQRAKPRPTQVVAAESPDNRVIRVLQSVAQRVTEEAESQLVSASPPKPNELQDLVKQKHVLEQTVDAYDKAISGHNPSQDRRLAVAAQNVVVQAAHTVIADRTVASGGIPVQQSETAAIKSVTVSELSDATQDAIAQAVKREGSASTEVDIIVAATSILKSRTAGSPAPVTDPSQANLQHYGHSAGTVPRLLPQSTGAYPPSLPSMPGYA